MRNKPVGSKPNEIENDRLSPSTVGEKENDSFLDRVYEDREYENEVIGESIVNESVTDRLLTSLNALIVTD